MESEKDTVWRSSVEELRRQIDYQHTEYEFYQKQATLFFRISVATVGVMIAILSIFGKETVLGASNYLLNFTLEQAAAQINLSDILTELVIALLYLEFTGFSLAFVKELGSIPVYTFQASYPNRLKSGLTEYQARKLIFDERQANDGSRKDEEDLIEYLRRAIVENEVIVERTGEKLRSTLEAVRNSVIHGFFAALTFAALLKGQALFDLAIVTIASLAAIAIASTEIPWQKYGRFLYPDWQNVLPLMLVVGWAISNALAWVPSPSWTVYLPGIALVIPPFSIWFSDLEDIRDTIPQAVGLFFLTFTGLFIHTNIQKGNLNDLATYILSVVTVFLVALSAYQIVIYNVAIVVEKIEESGFYEKIEEKLREYLSLTEEQESRT